MMEAEHVNKKYKTIRLHLLKDSVQFESALAKIEQEIKKQESEIRHLEIVNKEALGLRDLTKGTLLRQEIAALNAGKNRDNQLQDFRYFSDSLGGICRQLKVLNLCCLIGIAWKSGSWNWKGLSEGFSRLAELYIKNLEILRREESRMKPPTGS